MENAFGILSQQFRVFNTPIFLNVNTIEDLVTTTCILHNVMIDEKMRGARNYDHIDENAASDLESLIEPDTEVHTNQAVQIREIFKNYFNSEVGSVPWQNETFRW